MPTPPTTRPPTGRIGRACSFCLLALLFSLPFSTSASNILAVLLLLLWLGEGRFREKFAEIRDNEVALAVLAYLALHLLGLLWSHDLGAGLAVVQSQWKLLLLPVVLTMTTEKERQRYLYSFLAAMGFAMIASYLLWLGIVTNQHATRTDPTPFMTHIVYDPFLAWAIYLALHQAFLRPASKRCRAALALLALAMTVNLFITQGRAGQIAFLALLVLFSLQYWRGKILPAIGATLMLIVTLLAVGYATSPNFRERLSLTIHEATIYRSGQDGSNTSVGQRLTYARNTLRLIQNHPLLGVGSGDFVAEYKKINQRYTPGYPATDNPHNQYLKAGSQFGVVGLLLLLLIFYRQVQAARHGQDDCTHLRLALPLFFFVLCLGESYLQIHPTTLLFATFTGLLFKRQRYL